MAIFTYFGPHPEVEKTARAISSLLTTSKSPFNGFIMGYNDIFGYEKADKLTKDFHLKATERRTIDNVKNSLKKQSKEV